MYPEFAETAEAEGLTAIADYFRSVGRYEKRAPRGATWQALAELEQAVVTPGRAAAGIKALDRAGLAALIADLGQPRFRAKQLERWLYGRGARSFDEMTDLPAGLRETLAGRLALPSPIVRQRQQSSDGTGSTCSNSPTARPSRPSGCPPATG